MPLVSASEARVSGAIQVDVTGKMGTPYEFDLLAGARGVQLAEAGLESSRTGARVALPGLAVAG